MRKSACKGWLRIRAAKAGVAAAVVLTLGIGATSAYATSVVQESDGVAAGRGEASAATESEQGTAEGEDIERLEPGIVPVEGQCGPETEAGMGGQPFVVPPTDLPSDFNTLFYRNEKGRIVFVPAGETVTYLEDRTSGEITMTSGWYTFRRSVSWKGRGEVDGDVKIVIPDGVRVEWVGGIHVRRGSSLTIYGQCDDSGELICDRDSLDEDAGIGGNQEESGSTITICGSHVVAKGGDDAAGIGGGGDGWKVKEWCGGRGGNITIYGGVVDATGNDTGAGIGGGNGAAGGYITIYGGTVNAYADECAYHLAGGAAIGGGNRGDAGEIKILGGVVNAHSEQFGAAIGGGDHGEAGEILIENATVTAKCDKYGSGIGCGHSDSGGFIRIRNANVTAETDCGGAIGGGYPAGGCEVSIEGSSRVDAKSNDGAAIGRGQYGADDRPGIVHLEPWMRVSSHDDGGKIVPAAEREGYCKYRNHVTVECCEHANKHYDKNFHGHTLTCENCMIGRTQEEHHFDENNHCTDCGYIKYVPSFREADVIDSKDGINGLEFRYNLPKEGYWEGCHVTISVGGKNGRTVDVPYAESKGGEVRGFRIALTPLEVAEDVTAVLHWADGDMEPVTFSLADAFDARAADGSEGSDAARQLAMAQANFSYYMQRLLSVTNGWVIGDDYAEVKQCFPELNDVEGARGKLAKFATKKVYGAALIGKMKMSAVYGAESTARITLMPKPGERFDDVHAFTDKDERREVQVAQLADGSMRVSVEGIKVADFDMPIVICGKNAGGDASFRIETSLLGYAQAVVDDERQSAEAREASASTYWLYKYTQDFLAA